MAHMDQNGLVLIDEIEAGEDIKKLNASLELMKESLSILEQVTSVNSTFKGDTAIAIETVNLELARSIKQQITSIEDEIKLINSVVDKYKTIDSGMKNQINSAMN